MQPTLNAIVGHQHQTRLERVRAYIRDHYAEEIRMAELAKLAGFSKFHFHRIFRETFGETLRDYIRRIRLEKSAYRFMTGGNFTITDVAYDCGFSSSQSFTHVFKAHYGIPPTRFGANFDARLVFSEKMQNMEGNYGKKYVLPAEVRPDGVFIQIPVWTQSGRTEDSFQELEVVDMPSFRVAYVRTVAYPGSEPLFTAMNSLIMWATPKGLFTGDSLLLGAVGTIPDPEGRITYDASITIAKGIDADEDSGVRIQYLPEGEYGVYHGKFQTMAEVVLAWKKLTLGWWISSYFPRERRPLYEIYYNNPDMHPSKAWIIDICLPITTLHKK